MLTTTPQDIENDYILVNIDNIFLDLDNPRVPLSIRENKDGKSKDELNDEILNYLIQTGSITELMLSIGENGFFKGEALLLIKDTNEQGEFTGNYIVVEGNRRVTALKLLNNPELAQSKKNAIKEAESLSSHKPTDIPSIIFNSKDEILKYLGYRHITGIKNWKALEKARYLNIVYNKLKESGTKDSNIFDEIAKSIGSRPSYVARILQAYSLYLFIEKNDFFNIPGLDDTKFHFVNLSDSLNRSNLRDFLLNNDENKEFNEENLKTWTEWLFKENSEGETRLKGTSSDLSDLDQVVGNSIALEAFKDKKLTLSQAVFASEDAEDILSICLEEALANLEEADRVLTKVDSFEKVKSFDEDIKSIRKLAKKIYDYKFSQEDEY